jgi:endonuclease/exonuclease/phosphatase (EEP) superfamily protein YafD
VISGTRPAGAPADDPQAPRSWRSVGSDLSRAGGSVARLAGWAIVAALALLTLLRLTHSDSFWLVVVATSVSPWLYFLAWIVAAVGAVGRRWLLTGAAGVLVVISIVWLVPQWYPLARAAAAAPGAVPLTIFDANVEFTNPSLAPIAGEIRADHPNVVTLEELSYGNYPSLEASGVLAAYRWHEVIPDGGGGGFGVWSDIPMTGAQTWRAGSHLEIRAWLHPAGTPRVRFYVVHTDAPRSGTAAMWHTEMSAITAALRSEPHPLLVAGDFNATWDMYEFQDILHLGLKDAAVEEGKGWEMSWSRQARVVPPIVRIDHVLYSSGLTVTGYRTGVGQGSDHRPIMARLAIARS